jgi:alkaline phosphatase
MRADRRPSPPRRAAGAAIAVMLSAALFGAGCGGRAPAGKGVMLFVGDGMGVASLTAARIHRAHERGATAPAPVPLRMESAPRSCLVRTASSNAMVTDSAASMTAMVTGAKVPNGVLSLDVGSGRPLKTLLEEAEARGLSTGIVTTTTLTHATPAALYAHVENRRSEEEIATALLPGGNPALGDGVEVLLGGGRVFFLPGGPAGGRTDGRDLVAEMRQAGYAYVESADELRAAVAAGGKVLGLFAESHMAFEADRAAAATQPSLAEMTARAIEVLRRNPRGYFLMVEGGRIDHAHHFNNGRRAIADVLAFDDAVGAALAQSTDRDLIVVTADHDHTMVIAGYPAADQDVFTQAGVDASGIPYTAILYANGPSALTPPPATLTAEQLDSVDFQERAGVPLQSDTHGGMDVPLFAFGPERFHRDLPASIDNTEIFGRLLRALGSTD